MSQRLIYHQDYVYACMRGHEPRKQSKERNKGKVKFSFSDCKTTNLQIQSQWRSENHEIQKSLLLLFTQWEVQIYLAEQSENILK